MAICTVNVFMAGKSFSSTGIRTKSGSSAGQSLSVGLSVSLIAYALFCNVVFVSYFSFIGFLR